MSNANFPVVRMPTQQGVDVQCTPDRPRKRSHDKDEPDPVWHCSMCDNQATVTLDAWWDDPVLMRMLVAGSWQLRWADLNEGIVAGRRVDGFDAPVCDGLEGGRLGCRGIALNIIIELERRLAWHIRAIIISVSRSISYPSCHHEACLTGSTQMSAVNPS